MKLKYEFSMQEMDGKYAAVAVNDDVGMFNGLLWVNEEGKAILELLSEDIKREALISSLMEKFDAEEADIVPSLDAFLQKLDEQELLA